MLAVVVVLMVALLPGAGLFMSDVASPVFLLALLEGSGGRSLSKWLLRIDRDRFLSRAGVVVVVVGVVSFAGLLLGGDDALQESCCVVVVLVLLMLSTLPWRLGLVLNSAALATGLMLFFTPARGPVASRPGLRGVASDFVVELPRLNLEIWSAVLGEGSERRFLRYCWRYLLLAAPVATGGVEGSLNSVELSLTRRARRKPAVVVAGAAVAEAESCVVVGEVFVGCCCCCWERLLWCIWLNASERVKGGGILQEFDD